MNEVPRLRKTLIRTLELLGDAIDDAAEIANELEGPTPGKWRRLVKEFEAMSARIDDIKDKELR